MPTQNLRQPAAPRPRLHHLRPRIIDPGLVERVERAFDRGSLPEEIDLLFSEGKLGGTKVQTVDQEMAPIGAVRYATEPAIRERLEGLIEEGNERPEIRPAPKARLIVTVGWPGVYVTPSGRRSVRIKRISGPQGGSSDETAVEALREAVGAHTYYLDVDGTDYPIVDIEGSVLELGTDLRFSGPQNGAIYNGASRLLMISDPESGSRERAKDRAENTTTGRPTPVLSAEAMPGPCEIVVKARRQDQSARQSDSLEVTVSRPDTGRVKGTGYRDGSPVGNPGTERGLNRTMNTLVANVEVPHPDSDAVLLGLRHRVATRSSGEWRYNEPTFRPFSAATLRWMLQSDPDSDVKSGIVDLGRYSSSHKRRIEISFIDEMGRSVHTAETDQPAQPSGGGFEAHPNLGERFSTLAEQSAKPANKDIVRFYDKADSKIDPLEGEAESIVEKKSPEEVPLEQFKPPNARLKTEALGGKRVQISASESGHPNGLDNRYRFDWSEDGAWNTALGEQETIEHVFEDGGTKTIRVQAVDEVDATDEATDTIILPKAIPRVTFEDKTATLDGSESVRNPSFPLEYRMAFQTWSSSSSYGSGARVYYPETETIYKTTTSVPEGTPPVGLDGELTSGWAKLSWKESPTAEKQFSLPDGTPGRFYQVALEVRDGREAKDEGTKEIYFPNFDDANASVKARGSVATLQIDPPDVEGVEFSYSVDWTGDGALDAGPTTSKEISYNYSDTSASQPINVEAQTALGATTNVGVSVSFVTATISSFYYTASTSTLNVDASGSTTTASGGLEYRFRVANGERDFGEWTAWGGPQRDLNRPPSENENVTINEVRVEAEARDENDSVDTDTANTLLVSENGGEESPGKAPDILTPGQKIRVVTPGANFSPEGYKWEFRVDWNDGNGFTGWQSVSVFERAVDSGGTKTVTFEGRTTNPEVPEADRDVYSETTDVTFPTASVSTTVNRNRDGRKRSTIKFDASGSSHPAGDDLKYRWDWINDGKWNTEYNKDAAQKTKTFNRFRSGSRGSRSTKFTVRLGVKDSSGAVNTTTKEVDLSA